MNLEQEFKWKRMKTIHEHNMRLLHENESLRRQLQTKYNMRDLTEIRNEIEEILNVHTPLKGKQIIIEQLLKIVEREQNKSYDNGYRLKSLKRNEHN